MAKHPTAVFQAASVISQLKPPLKSAEVGQMQQVNGFIKNKGLNDYRENN